MAEGITDLDASSFDEAISSSDKPVLVAFGLSGAVLAK